MEANKRLGLALCGSYCTYDQVFAAAEKLAGTYELVPIMSETAAETDSRFGRAVDHIRSRTDVQGWNSLTAGGQLMSLIHHTHMMASL